MLWKPKNDPLHSQPLPTPQAPGEDLADQAIPAERAMGSMQLADIIDVRALQSLMDDFYGLTRIPMSLIDLEGQVLAGAGWQKICTNFHRKHPDTLRHCIESDTRLTADIPEGEHRLYKCMNNMWDAATPILVGGRHLGHLFTGQFFFEDELPDYEAFRAQAARYGFPEEEYLAAVEAVPRVSRAAIETAMAYLMKFATLISQLSFSNFKLARMLAERESLMRSLGKSEERLARAQEIAHLGSWELDLVDNDLTWSDEVYRIFGLRPQEFGASYQAFLEAVHPDDRAAVDAAYSGSLREGRDTYTIEHRIVRNHTGEIRYVHEKCEHFRDDAGRLIRSVGMVHDLTERRQAEESLRESELFYRQTLESIPGMVFTTRPDGYCDFQSQQWVDFTGVPMSEHLGNGWNKLLHPDDRPRAFAAWRNAVEERAPYDLEYRVRRHDGEYEWFKVRGRPIRNEAGEIVRWFGTALNIDKMVRTQEELRQAKEAAEAATRVKGQFLANMSHELRTPMTGILGMLDLALRGELTAEQRGYLETVRKSSHSLLRILNDVLDFSRIESAGITLIEEPFRLRECVREVIELFALEARSKNLGLAMEIAPGTPERLEGDEGRIRQILVNLVGNAVKFTEQGRVSVRVAAGEATADGRREVAFTVADTGIGIPGEKQHLLFRPFSQGEASHNRRFGGTGLGLAIGREVAERMGGTLAFTSAPGVGSTFVATLPLREAAAVATAAAAAPVPAPAAVGAGRPRLLVAEDDRTIQKLLGIMLRRGGIDLDTAVNGEEAVGMWARGGYDLILMDMQMPLMDGFEATRAIRAQEAALGGHIPIVALTAHAFPTDQQKCLDAGMDAYLAKPIEFQKLFAMLRELLGTR